MARPLDETRIPIEKHDFLDLTLFIVKRCSKTLFRIQGNFIDYWNLKIHYRCFLWIHSTEVIG